MGWVKTDYHGPGSWHVVRAKCKHHVSRPWFVDVPHSPGRRFDIGGHKVEYEASDEAGWSSKCVFTVVLRQETTGADPLRAAFAPRQYSRLDTAPAVMRRRRSYVVGPRRAALLLLAQLLELVLSRVLICEQNRLD
ncbi:hypothetical protein WN48_05319 [Eufriesea mexicana]|uniref:HYR domain-containing protein n=1 Tax=Eufriesea mexicana TaxID=516756 RepID=A0A310SD01_9HYME|nr:hypothetical protein WN48_05319 [Eufriesea mexicana]